MLKYDRLKYKPWLSSAQKAHKKKQIVFKKSGTAVLSFKGRKISIPPKNQFDLTQATIFGLNERLTLSSNSPVIGEKKETLRELFNKEWEKYAKALTKAKDPALNYGVYAYYAEKNELVRYCEPFWHRVAATASSSMLLSSKNGGKTWLEVRKILSQTTVAVAGCSVGGSIIHASMMDLRPENIKIADKSLYKMENINRVRLNYSEIVSSNAGRKNAMESLLQNKAAVTAKQIYSTDPFVNVYVYEEGVTESNANIFINGSVSEPPADIIVEEVDDPRVKIMLRFWAKKYRLPLIMATDLGSSVQLDIVRFDQNSNSTMAFGTPDSTLIKSMEKVYEYPGNRKVFFKFVDKLIGTDYRRDELKKIIDQKTEIPTSTIIPQLGSTIAVAGGIVAEAIARIRLGYDYPHRVIFNKKNFRVKIYR